MSGLLISNPVSNGPKSLYVGKARIPHQPLARQRSAGAGVRPRTLTHLYASRGPNLSGEALKSAEERASQHSVQLSSMPPSRQGGARPDLFLVTDDFLVETENRDEDSGEGDGDKDVVRTVLTASPLKAKCWLPPLGQPVRGGVIFMHGTWASPEVYGLQLRAMAESGVLVVAPCSAEGLEKFVDIVGHFPGPNMFSHERPQFAYQRLMRTAAELTIKQLFISGHMLNQLQNATGKTLVPKDLPWAFYGHSVGADLLFGLARFAQGTCQAQICGLMAVNPSGTLQEGMQIANSGHGTAGKVASIETMVLAGRMDWVSHFDNIITHIATPLEQDQSGGLFHFAKGGLKDMFNGFHTDMMDFCIHWKDGPKESRFPLIRALDLVSFEGYTLAVKAKIVVRGTKPAQINLGAGQLDDEHTSTFYDMRRGLSWWLVICAMLITSMIGRAWWLHEQPFPRNNEQFTQAFILTTALWLYPGYLHSLFCKALKVSNRKWLLQQLNI